MNAARLTRLEQRRGPRLTVLVFQRQGDGDAWRVGGEPEQHSAAAIRRRYENSHAVVWIVEQVVDSSGKVVGE